MSLLELLSTSCTTRISWIAEYDIKSSKKETGLEQHLISKKNPQSTYLENSLNIGVRWSHDTVYSVPLRTKEKREHLSKGMNVLLPCFY